MADKWLADKEIDVEVDSLKDFADHIKAELEKNFRPSFEDGIKPMLTVQAPFGGGSDMKEGAFFRNRHDESRAAASQLLGEVMKGMAALSMAAMSIQAEYLMGDAFAEAEQDKVYDAFNGGDGQKTLEDYWKQPDKEDGKPTNPDTVPEEAKDPSKYFEGDGAGDGGGSETSSGDGGGMHDGKDVGGEEGDPGHYHIDADDENMHDSKYEMPSSANE